MTTKKIFSTELSYLLALPLMALGIALMTIADMGMSMISAPAYLISLKTDRITFGQAEYLMQAFFLTMMCIAVRKFRISWLLSFVTAFLYGSMLDGFLALMSGIPTDSIFLRVVWFSLGMCTVSLSVSLFFHTYLPSAVYELFVKIISGTFRLNISKFKIGFDLSLLLLAVVFSFCFFGFGVFRGLGIATVASAVFNGFIIAACSRFLDRHFDFRDAFPWRKFFL